MQYLGGFYGTKQLFGTKETLKSMTLSSTLEEEKQVKYKVSRKKE